MFTISHNNIEDLAVGAALLGSGGGGSTAYGLMAAKYAIEKYGDVSIISLDSLKDDALIVPLGNMGAPLVGIERLSHDVELEAILNEIEKKYDRTPDALAITEIGGGNAFTPFYIAGKLGLPIVDGDLIGRAFPQLQMISPTVHGLKPETCYMSDIFGNTFTINCKDMKLVEKYARQITVALGSSAPIVLHVLTGKIATQTMISNSVSRACTLGNILLNSKENQKTPISALMKSVDCKHLGTGSITDVNQVIENGFLIGSITIENELMEIWNVECQNEYLFVYKNNECIAQTPDIIALIDSESGQPISSEAVSFGIRVDIVSLKSPEIWYSAPGLDLVGPKVFSNIIKKV